MRGTLSSGRALGLCTKSSQASVREFVWSTVQKGWVECVSVSFAFFDSCPRFYSGHLVNPTISKFKLSANPETIMVPVLWMLLELLISIAITIMTWQSWHWLKTADFWVHCFKVFLCLPAPLKFRCFARPHGDFTSWFKKCGKKLHRGNFYGLEQPPSLQQ